MRFLALAVLLLASVLHAKPEVEFLPIGDEYFQLEVARTPEELERGLMGRATLPEDAGMLFLLTEKRIARFWMRETLIPLDILFLDEDGRIAAIHTMKVEPPRGKDQSEEEYLGGLPLYSSRRPVVAAIELNAGVAQCLGLKVGDKLLWKPSNVKESDDSKEQRR